VRHVADIGGGTGTLIAEVLRRNPQLRGTLADLPETAARARQYLAGLGLDGRCEVIGQSFFDPLAPWRGRLLLNRVIHDWDDAAATAILRRCAEAAGSTGRVLVIESHGTPGGDPTAFAEMNLRMLVLSGGRERTIDDYSALAAGAGLQVTVVHGHYRTSRDHRVRPHVTAASSSWSRSIRMTVAADGCWPLWTGGRGAGPAAGRWKTSPYSAAAAA